MANGYSREAVDDPKDLYEHRAEYQILDVREPYEWVAGHIEEAVHIPLAQVMGGSGLEAITSDRPVAVVCRVGNRSELAALMLQARGMEAHNLEGGTEGWMTAGLPLEAADGGPGRVA